MTSPENPTALRVAVIGGGPGGLMTAYRLEKLLPVPCQVTIFEATPRLGGKIISAFFAQAPIRYEAGAAELYDYSPLGTDPLRELIAELGLSTISLRGGAVVMRDRLMRGANEIRQELGSAAAEALRLFRRQARSAISPADYYESDWRQNNSDPLARQTFRECLDAVTDAGARRYLEISTHSDLACEPTQTNAFYGLQNFLMDEPDYLRLYTIEGGIERLPQELAQRTSARILLDHRVSRVEQSSPETYRVYARHGRETVEEDFDFVVVALPNNWIPAIQWSGGDLAAAMAAHHLHYDHPAHYLRVSLLFDRPFWKELIPESYFMLEAFGGCCVYDECSRSGGSDLGALGWLIAGDAALNLSNYDDAFLFAAVLDSLPDFLQHGRKHFREGRVHRWVGSVNALPGGYPARDPDARHVPEPVGHPRLYVVGDYLFDSTLNGVLDSADVVVEHILDEIEPAAEEDPLLPRLPESIPREG